MYGVGLVLLFCARRCLMHWFAALKFLARLRRSHVLETGWERRFPGRDKNLTYEATFAVVLWFQLSSWGGMHATLPSRPRLDRGAF